MSAQEELVQSNESAVSDDPIESGASYSVNVTGEKTGGKISGKAEGGKPKKKFGAAVVITGLLVIIMFLMLAVPSFAADHLATNLVKVTDVQCADSVESKTIVFAMALRQGDVPDTTAMRLKEQGMIVGYQTNDEFAETNKSPDGLPLSVKIDDRVISADEFYQEINSNASSYGMFKEATYSCVENYYDESATTVLKNKIGISGNVMSGGKTLDESMDKVMGEGNDLKLTDRTWHYV